MDVFFFLLFFIQLEEKQYFKKIFVINWSIFVGRRFLDYWIMSAVNYSTSSEFY